MKGIGIEITNALMGDIDEWESPCRVMSIDDCAPRIKLTAKPTVFIDGKELRGVISHNIKSSENGSELLIRIHVQPSD